MVGLSDDPSRHLGGPLFLEEVTGAVLCGGRSTRFGSDKARHVVAGRTLVERALDSLACGRSVPSNVNRPNDLYGGADPCTP